MTNQINEINKVGSTAFVIASIRHLESEKERPLFSDPFAEWFSNPLAEEAVKKMELAFTPSTSMIRFRTRYFDELIHSQIQKGVKQIVLLGGGFDMRAHRLNRAGVTFYEVDQRAVLEHKTAVLKKHGLTQPPSLMANYLETDVSKGLVDLGFDLTLPSLFIWEGNTMYLPPESIIPFINSLADNMPFLGLGFDYFSVDLQDREQNSAREMKIIEAIEKALNVSFATGFKDLSILIKNTQYKLGETGSFYLLAEQFGRKDIIDAFPEDWQLILQLYRYCLLTTK